MYKGILYILFIIIGFVFPKSKFVRILILIFMLIAAIWAIGNVDYLHYEYNYNLIKIGGINQNFEIGFQYLNQLGVWAGLEFKEFYVVINTILFIFVNMLISRYSKKPNKILSLYLIFPFLTDLVQFRNFISMVFIIYAVSYLFNSKTSYIKFIILILLASTFHITSLFYLLLIFTKFIDKRVLLIGATVVAITIFVLNDQIIQILSGFIDVSKIGYFHSEVSSTTKLLLILYVIIFGYALSKLKKRNKLEHFIDSKADLDVIIGVNIVIMISLAFVMRDLNFIRIFRNLMLITYLVIPPLLLNDYKKIRLSLSSLLLHILIIIASIWWVLLAYTNNGPISIIS